MKTAFPKINLQMEFAAYGRKPFVNGELRNTRDGIMEIITAGEWVILEYPSVSDQETGKPW